MNFSEYSLYFKVFFLLFVLGIYGTGYPIVPFLFYKHKLICEDGAPCEEKEYCQESSRDYRLDLSSNPQIHSITEEFGYFCEDSMKNINFYNVLGWG